MIKFSTIITHYQTKIELFCEIIKKKTYFSTNQYFFLLVLKVLSLFYKIEKEFQIMKEKVLFSLF